MTTAIDVITQVAAVRAALKRVEEEVLRDHVSHCVEHAISGGDPREQRVLFLVVALLIAWSRLFGVIAESSQNPTLRI